MEIFNLFESDNREKWIAQIEKCDWSAAAFLAKLLRENRFEETLGADGSLFVMTDGEKLAAFCTLTSRDSIKGRKPLSVDRLCVYRAGIPGQKIQRKDNLPCLRQGKGAGL